MSSWVAKVNELHRPRFSVLWRDMSRTNVCHEHSTWQVTSIFSPRCDYQLAGFALSPGHQLFARFATGYLTIWRFVRPTLLGISAIARNTGQHRGYWYLLAKFSRLKDANVFQPSTLWDDWRSFLARKATIPVDCSFRTWQNTWLDCP
jgi:hypothetical protein